jgi:hypothetical protein
MKTKINFNAIIIGIMIFAFSTNDANAQRGNLNNTRPIISNNTRPIIINRNIYRPRNLNYGRRNKLPYNYASIIYRGRPYFYANGLYYSNVGNYYNLITPPFGLTVSLLPRGYWGFNYGGFPHYYVGGIFYRATNDRQYEIIEPPMGAEVPSIPTDAKLVIINEQKFYEYLGTYYKEVTRSNGTVSYIVQGKDGILNTNQNQ